MKRIISDTDTAEGIFKEVTTLSQSTCIPLRFITYHKYFRFEEQNLHLFQISVKIALRT